MVAKTARWVNSLVGVWLFASAFVWPHTIAQSRNTWATGAIAVAIALSALAVPVFRYLNTAVGLWLIISAFALPTNFPTTRWNNVIVGIVIGVVALIGESPGPGPLRRPRPA